MTFNIQDLAILDLSSEHLVGLNPEEQEKIIQQAFRKKIRKYHSDKLSGNHEDAVAVINARERLINSIDSTSMTNEPLRPSDDVTSFNESPKSEARDVSFKDFGPSYSNLTPFSINFNVAQHLPLSASLSAQSHRV